MTFPLLIKSRVPVSAGQDVLAVSKIGIDGVSLQVPAVWQKPDPHEPRLNMRRILGVRFQSGSWQTRHALDSQNTLDLMVLTCFD